MSNDIPPIHEQHFVNALVAAVEAGWLSPVEHGYCFYCNEEKFVYEVRAKDVPVQPPRCESCFIEQAFDLMASDEMMADLKKNLTDGTP